MPSEYSEVDVSEWEPAGEEQIGSKPKHWLFEPTTEQGWLWKPRTFNVARGGEQYAKGDDWAERLACEFGRCLGIPCADVELAKNRDELGIISRSFTNTPDDAQLELVPGNVLLGAAVEGYHPSKERGGAGYNVESVRDVLEGVGPPLSDAPLTTAPIWFVAYLFFDAWIGNTDRHHQNWGVLRSQAENTQVLAPSFDHASSLGFLISDQERSDRLATRDAGYSVQAFARRADTPFEGRPHPVEVAVEGLNLVKDDVVEALVTKLVEEQDHVPEIVSRVPSHRMTEPARAFAIQMLTTNASSLLSQATRRLNT